MGKIPPFCSFSASRQVASCCISLRDLPGKKWNVSPERKWKWKYQKNQFHSHQHFLFTWKKVKVVKKYCCRSHCHHFYHLAVSLGWVKTLEDAREKVQLEASQVFLWGGENKARWPVYCPFFFLSFYLSRDLKQKGRWEGAWIFQALQIFPSLKMKSIQNSQ